MTEKTTPSSDKRSEKDETHGWDETIRTFIYALCIALVFRSLLFEPFHIPSGSMKDTLLIGDYVFVAKYEYGYSRYSFPLGLDVFDGRIGSNDRPERGDVVVFRLPSAPSIDFIKRVIGLPGDTVQVIDGVPHINGMPVERKSDGLFTDRLPDGTYADIRRYIETLPNGVSHRVLDEQYGAEQDNTLVFTVPEGHYFMMGDNRDNSMDSRFSDDVGFVPEDNLVGEAKMILFSVDDRTRMWKVWDWFWALRTDRFFKIIE